ncbi:ATP-binding cassette domain-containing protein [Terasakiella sp. A23]|uniref:peptidase domain-containing ABC transporter n=1 Tax=Terasakiella sp. FCG-A23 TaxID=3080561 RepID=UPI002952B14C|nr:ATP-binding cassette domain-containing protein [Terasakiella sp. A23]MDV7338742.1 ATP-binding cassette domain-containing protein [Terasakiella sp. A23]
MSFFVNMLALVVPVFVLQVYDRVVFHAGIETLQGLVIGVLLVLVFDYSLRQARSKIMQRVALRIDVEVGRKLFRQFTSVPLQTLESKPAAYWQTLFRDVDTVRNTLSGGTAILLVDLPFVFLFLGLILMLALPIAWVFLIILPCFLFVAWRSGNVMNSANQEEKKTTLSRDDLIAGVIAGRTTVKALAMDRTLEGTWEERHADNIENSIIRGGKADAYTNLGMTLTLMTTISLTTVGAIAIINQELTMGSLIATNMLSGRLLGPMNQLVGSWRSFSGFKQSVERLGVLFAMPIERQESEVKMSRPEGHISLDKVTFKYSEELEPVVDGVSFNLKPGALTALVGRNGSGKTTLIKLLQGLYVPESGRVLLDKADIKQFTRYELASWIGYVPQECALLHGTVRENLVFSRPEATDEEIIAACQATGVHDTIIDLPEGYGSDIGEAGRRLSGGQKQRLTISRALLGNPPVLLLDEPSGSLDRQAEEELRDLLAKLAEDHTIILVTHSPVLLGACANMIVMDHGRIALAGQTKDVLPKLAASAQQKKQEEPKTVPSPTQTPMPKVASKPIKGAPASKAKTTAPKPVAEQPKQAVKPTTTAKPSPKPTQAPVQQKTIKTGVQPYNVKGEK